jgi:LysR family transcriptional regulator, low CO2-responsive transcriptional regulator
MRNVTIRQLQVFCEAAQGLSFARAAQRLRLSPAAISFQIKQIESMTGFALFERVGRKVALTDAGAELLVYAKTILRALHDADQTLTAQKGATGGQVTMGLVSTAKYIVPHMLTRFRERHPAIVIKLREGNRRQIIDVLTKGEIDLAIMGQPPQGADVLAEAFAAHPSVLIAAPSHRLANSAALPPGILADEVFLVREEGSGTRSLLEQFLHMEKLSPRVGLTSSSNETIKHAVMAGMGVALISRHTVGLELGLGLVATLAVDGLPLMRSWFIARRGNMPMLPVYCRLWTFFVEQGQSIIDDLERGYDEVGSRIRKKTSKRGGRGSRKRRKPGKGFEKKQA